MTKTHRYVAHHLGLSTTKRTVPIFDSTLEQAKAALLFKPARDHWKAEATRHGMLNKSIALAHLRHEYSTYDEIIRKFRLDSNQVVKLRQYVNEHFLPYIRELDK